MISTDQVRTLLDQGGAVFDESGSKIGKVGQVYLDDETGSPQWVTAATGLFGTSETFIPLEGASVQGSDVRVPYSKDKIKDAPRVDSDGHISPSEEADLYAYYGLAYGSEPGTTREAGQGTDTARGVGHDTSGPNTDDAMTRSEEQLHVGTEKRPTGKARLRKYVVSENETRTVPVTREEARVEREPITDANRDQAMSGGDITEEEHEVTLNEERVVVDKETVPVERVRLDKEAVTDEEQVSEEVRKEQVESDVVDTSGDRNERR